MNNLTNINPFFAVRRQWPVFQADAEPYKAVYAKLPRAPINASPVPTLTSLYHSAEAGNYGNRGYSDREAGFVPLTYHTKRIAFECGLKQHSTDIIRFSHGASSGRKVYRSAFIPGLHDICMIFQKPDNTKDGAKP